MGRTVSIYTDIDVDRDEVLDQIGEEYVREWLSDPEPREYDLSDPVTLLGVITELRRLGYSVEPGDGNE